METKDIIRIGRTRLGMTHQAFADAGSASCGSLNTNCRAENFSRHQAKPQTAPRRFFYAHTFKNDSKKCELLTQLNQSTWLIFTKFIG